MAHHSRLTPELHERLVKTVRKGLPRSLATAAAGISEQTLDAWLRQAESEEGAGPYTRLANDLLSAEAERAGRCLRQIRVAAETGSWQAAAWFLERRYPESFGRRVAIERTADPPAPVELSPGQAYALLTAALEDLLLKHPELEQPQRAEVAR